MGSTTAYEYFQSQSHSKAHISTFWQLDPDFLFSGSKEKQNAEATNLEVLICHEINLENWSADY